jgi:biopolymer transport protein ExbD
MHPLIVLAASFVTARFAVADEVRGCLTAIEVVVAGDNTCHVNQSTYSCDELGLILRSMGANPKCDLHIRAEKEARVEITAAAMASLAKAGFAKVGFAINERK